MAKKIFIISMFLFVLLAGFVYAEELAVTITPSTVSPSTAINIGIESATTFYQYLYIYDSDDKYKGRIKADCPYYRCTNSHTLEYNIGSDFIGSYYVKVFDYNRYMWVKTYFQVEGEPLDITITPNEVLAGETITINIKPNSRGISRELQFYDSSDRRKATNELGCEGKEICRYYWFWDYCSYDKKCYEEVSFSYNIPTDWKPDQYYLNIYSMDNWIKEYFNINQLIGDVNGDGVIDNEDVDLITLYVAGSNPFEVPITGSAVVQPPDYVLDANSDGKIDALDAGLVDQIANNLEVSLTGFLRYGDVNGDNEVTAFDASMVLKSTVRIISFNENQKRAADVTGNGAVSGYDASFIMKYAAGMIDSFPVEALTTEKKMAQYSEKEVFLISDNNWRDVLPLVPLTTWTGNENCQRGYGTPANVCVYPTLIYHEETSSFDADSIIYFMQQYSPTKVTVIGDTPQELDNLLTAPEDGAGLNEEDIRRIYPTDYFSYWSSFKDVIYVEDNYELALLASTYSSLINAPLIIEGTALDTSSVFSGRNIICVGSATPAGSTCNEQYSLEQLQQKYVGETSTDKILLVNSNDLSIKVSETLYPKKSSEGISETYSKNSLTAPVLASAKQELILSTNSINYQDVDSFIETKINNLGLEPEYLTIVASPNAIEMSRLPSVLEGSGYVSVDAWEYAQIDDDYFLDLAVGRIFGITIADSSSNIARSLFYEQTLRNPDKVLVTRGSQVIVGAQMVYSQGKVLSSAGYQATATPSGTNSNDWKDKSLIFYHDHGASSWAGISSTWIPYLDNSFVFVDACSTCGFKKAASKQYLFCSNVIRNGGIGYMGTTDLAGLYSGKDFISETFAYGSTIGKSFMNAKNAINIQSLGRNYIPWYTLIGDPTLKLATPYTMPSPQLLELSDRDNEKDYQLVIPAMKIMNQEQIRQLSGNPDRGIYMYFSSAYGGGPLMENFWFAYRMQLLELGDFQPKSVLIDSVLGELAKETTNEGDVWWIISPLKSYRWFEVDPSEIGNYGYFTTANDQQFTNFEFDITLSSILIVNGACGSANNIQTTTKPTTNLCSAGTASAVTGIGPWYWTCIGSNGGSTASCSAPKTIISPPGTDNQTNTTGTINATSNPSEANTYVDAIFKGITPIAIANISVGNHTINITKQGYYSYVNDSVHVRANQTTIINAILRAIGG